MSLIDLERRLARLEAARYVGAPTALLTDAPIGDPAGDREAADAVANWRQWVAQGCATVQRGVLCLARVEMTTEEWAAVHVTGN